MRPLDYASRPRKPRGFTQAELDAIASYDGEVTVCPSGGRDPTWRPFHNGAPVSALCDAGMKSTPKGSPQ
jgi:hypothetical protein